jgi:IclR family transcriptional regulator, pca regulon regulatory protein
VKVTTVARQAEVEARENDDRDFVNSLARGLAVIKAFNRSRPSMTLSEVAKRTGINRAAARRFLLTLVREGYAETDGKYFRLRPKILELGFSALSSISLAEMAQSAMDDLADRIDEMCLAAVLDGEWVVYVLRTSTQRVVSLNLDVGSRLPAFCMSTGRVLLAALPNDELDRWLDHLDLVRYTQNTIVSKRKLREAILRARRDGYLADGRGVRDRLPLAVGPDHARRRRRRRGAQHLLPVAAHLAREDGARVPAATA